MKFPLLSTVLAVALGAAANSAAELTTGQKQGRELAQELASLRPSRSATNTGVLKIRDARGHRSEIPIRIETIRSDPSWESRYFIGPSSAPPRQVFSVRHSAADAATPPLQFFFQNGTEAGKSISAANNEAMQPLGGSDFWLADLALAFLHWPEQRLLKKELRRGESCNVLESLRADTAGDGYVRVVSWVDIDTGGIVHADAYDRDKKLVKVFEPKRFEKVNGRWQVKELEIRNEKTDSRTTLVFDKTVE